MITLHGATMSNYYNKVKIVLLEKNLPFTEQLQRTRSTDEAVLNATPLGKIPFVTIDGRTLCESQVIVDCLEAMHPNPPLVPADPVGAAKVRELCAFMELYVELVGRELYGEAFFGGKTSEEVKASVRERLTRNLAAFKRLVKFSPYIAGPDFTLADAAAYAALPAAAQATKAVFGEDLVAAAGIDWKPYMKMLGERPSVQRVNADRKRDAETAAAKAAAAAPKG